MVNGSPGETAKGPLDSQLDLVRTGVEDDIRRGVADGSIRPELDARAQAFLLESLARGVLLQYQLDSSRARLEKSAARPTTWCCRHSLRTGGPADARRPGSSATLARIRRAAPFLATCRVRPTRPALELSYAGEPVAARSPARDPMKTIAPPPLIAGRPYFAARKYRPGSWLPSRGEEEPHRVDVRGERRGGAECAL